MRSPGQVGDYGDSEGGPSLVWCLLVNISWQQVWMGGNLEAMNDYSSGVGGNRGQT